MWLDSVPFIRSFYLCLIEFNKNTRFNTVNRSQRQQQPIRIPHTKRLTLFLLILTVNRSIRPLSIFCFAEQPRKASHKHRNQCEIWLSMPIDMEIGDYFDVSQQLCREIFDIFHWLQMIEKSQWMQMYSRFCCAHIFRSFECNLRWHFFFHCVLRIEPMSLIMLVVVHLMWPLKMCAHAHDHKDINVHWFSGARKRRRYGANQANAYFNRYGAFVYMYTHLNPPNFSVVFFRWLFIIKSHVYMFHLLVVIA